jgi:hypothetical protein
MENNFEEGTIEMPQKLKDHVEGTKELTPEELAGEKISDFLEKESTEEILQDFNSIKDYIEREAGKEIKPGWLEMAEKQFDNKINNPNFTKEKAIQETINYLKEKMGIADDVKALREAAKIPYRQAENLVRQFKAGTNEVKYEDVIEQLQKAKEATEKAKAENMTTYLEQWTNDVEELNNARS